MAKTTTVAAARAAAKRAERARAQDAPATPDEETPGTTAEGGPEPERPRGTRQFRIPVPRVPRLAARHPRLPLIALAALLAAALAATVLLALEHRELERTRQARIDALAAAEEAAPEIFSYDHEHLDEDFERARGHLTGAFREEYERTTGTVVAPTAEKYDAVVTATVAGSPADDHPAASVVSASPDRVVVLLFMNQVTTSTRIEGERLDLNRVRMTMERTGDGWKVSAVDAL